MKFTTSFHSFSYQGQRDYQQDALFPQGEDQQNNAQLIFAVCDGMGGTEQGEVASQSVVKTIGGVHLALSSNQVLRPSVLSTFLSQAYNQLDVDGKNIDTGTTLAMLWLHAGGCAMVHLGDSRVYQFRQGRGIVYRSKDHSLVNELMEAHVITPEEALHHSKRNVITRCMEPATQNRRRDKATAFFTADIQKGDIFLICSDGVTGEVDDGSLVRLLLAQGRLEDKLATIAAFCENAADNATAILVEVEQVERGNGEVDAEPQMLEIDAEESDSHISDSLKNGGITHFFQRIMDNLFN